MIECTHGIRPVFAMVCCAVTIGCSPASTETALSTVEPSLPATEKHLAIASTTETTITTVEQPLPIAEKHPSTASSTDSSHADFYTVSTYDESLDPTDDLTRTIARAEAENKRVILQVGGDWCVWCHRITDFTSTNTTVRSHLGKNFLVMKVTFPSENSDEFLATYPKCVAYPYLIVLDKNGGFLHSQGTNGLIKGEGYDEEMFMTFLTKWTP